MSIAKQEAVFIVQPTLSVRDMSTTAKLQYSYCALSQIKPLHLTLIIGNYTYRSHTVFLQSLLHHMSWYRRFSLQKSIQGGGKKGSMK